MTRPGPRARVASPQIPRKSLGQHFLIDKNIVHKIVRLAELQPGEMATVIAEVRNTGIFRTRTKMPIFELVAG